MKLLYKHPELNCYFLAEERQRVQDNVIWFQYSSEAAKFFQCDYSYAGKKINGDNAYCFSRERLKPIILSDFWK